MTENHWHLLFSDQGGVGPFTDAVAPLLPEAALGDLRRRDRRSLQQLQLSDPSVEALRQLHRRDPADPARREKYQSLLQSLNDREAYYYQIHFRLAEAEARR